MHDPEAIAIPRTNAIKRLGLNFHCRRYSMFGNAVECPFDGEEIL